MKSRKTDMKRTLSGLRLALLAATLQAARADVIYTCGTYTGGTYDVISQVYGIIDLEGESRRFVFHGVHMTLDGRPGRPWKREQPRINELVFIGRNLDASALRSGFCDCASVLAAAS